MTQGVLFVLVRASAECASIDYGDLSLLPDTTVVFVFCNEEQSVLSVQCPPVFSDVNQASKWSVVFGGNFPTLFASRYRSIHAVLNRSPPQLLKEVRGVGLECLLALCCVLLAV